MTVEEFRASTSHDNPPPYLPPLLAALWWDAKGDWSRAHSMVDDLETIDGMRVHAHLHRKEGDASNARYWYSRAGRPFCEDPLELEWDRLVGEFLAAPA